MTLPLNHIKVVAVIILVDDVFAFRAELLKHGVQHLRHLFLGRQRTQHFQRSSHEPPAALLSGVQ